jgi:hypothetical protein
MDRKTQWDLFRRRLATSDPAECFNKLPPSYKISREDIEHYFRELAGYASLRNSVESYKEVIGQDFQAKISGVIVAANLFCYLATRILKPEIVIETGCATGWTSSLFLLALHQNCKGHLFSIDIPAHAGQYSMDWTLPSDLKPGFLVPHELRTRWTLILGDARVELIPLLEKWDKIDVFFHDSDHTYQHMM